MFNCSLILDEKIEIPIWKNFFLQIFSTWFSQQPRKTVHIVSTTPMLKINITIFISDQFIYNIIGGYTTINYYIRIILFRNDIIIKNERRKENYTEALEYFDSMATYTDELRKIQRSLRVLIRWVEYSDKSRYNPIEKRTAVVRFCFVDICNWQN